jgi:preprotein translocase subunit SecD
LRNSAREVAVAEEWMRFTRKITTMAMAAAIMGQTGAKAEDIALSLVNPKGRIDVPVSALQQVEARATFAYRIQGTDDVHEVPSPGVDVCFTKDIRDRICELTRTIVGEPLAIVVDCGIVVEPIVNQALCNNPCFQISANDFAEANALAQRIRRGTNRTCAPSS